MTENQGVDSGTRTMTPDKDANSCDPDLLPLLTAKDAQEVDFHVDRLIQISEPIVTRTVRRKMHVSMAPNRPPETQAQLDAEDIRSDALIIIAQLLRKIATTRQTKIRNFPHYVEAVAVHVYNEYLDDRYPERARIKNQVRHILQRTEQFALWTHAPQNAPSGDNSSEHNQGRGNPRRLCGLAQWQQDGRGLEESERLWQLLKDPQRLLSTLMHNCPTQQLLSPQLLENLFRWLEHPIEFQPLVMAVAALCGANSPSIRLAPLDDEPPDPNGTLEKIFGQEDMRRLWRVFCDLTPRQVAVILLDTRTVGQFLHLFPLQGIATMSEVARVIGMEFTTLIDLWEELPLADRQIAEIVGMPESLVPQLRARVREKLRHRMQDEENR
jgi:hypothetical protein